MTAAERSAAPYAQPLAPSALPGQSSAPRAAATADRLVRQVKAIDVWIAARRDREWTLRAQARTREARMIAAREMESLACTHEAIRRRCRSALNADLASLQTPGPTAVIAHRHAWFLDKLSPLLSERGIHVLVTTDNGAEALGAVIADQPDLVLVSDRIAMICGRAFLAEARRFAPTARLAAQAADPPEAAALRTAADTVLLRQHSLDVVADTLLALYLTPRA